MAEQPEERWKELCRQAAVEQDPQKLSQLVREINRLIEARHNTNGHNTHQMGNLTRT
jgi:hypothetical protein